MVDSANRPVSRPLLLGVATGLVLFWGSAVIVSTVGCGARVGYPGTTDAATRDAATRDASIPDPPDASLPCPHLVELVEPTRLMGGDGLHYVRPHVIARQGSFDVVAFQNTLGSAVEPTLVARRVTVLPGVEPELTALVAEDAVVLDPDIRTSSFAASDGEHLGVCYKAYGPAGTSSSTFQTHAGEYLPAHARAQFPQFAERCLALAGRPGRFRMFWLENGYQSPLEMLLVDLSPTGEPLGEPRSATVQVESTMSLEAMDYPGGFAWVTSTGHDGPIRVALSVAETLDQQLEHAVIGSGTRHNEIRLAPWPFDDAAVAVLWETLSSGTGPPTTLQLALLSEGGQVSPVTTMPRSFPFGVTPLAASFPFGLVVLAAEYDDYGALNGTLHASLLHADMDTHGPDVDLRFGRGAFNNDWDLSLAADDQHIVVVWSANLETPDPGVWAAVLGCAE